jgi:hypothetical protein
MLITCVCDDPDRPVRYSLLCCMPQGVLMFGYFSVGVVESKSWLHLGKGFVFNIDVNILIGVEVTCLV